MMAWCGTWNDEMFKPFFLHDTINAEQYLTMSGNKLMVQLDKPV
jgi:hypothetical protein